jgi:hypothetical protein
LCGFFISRLLQKVFTCESNLEDPSNDGQA